MQGFIICLAQVSEEIRDLKKKIALLEGNSTEVLKVAKRNLEQDEMYKIQFEEGIKLSIKLALLENKIHLENEGNCFCEDGFALLFDYNRETNEIFNITACQSLSFSEAA